jgi:hypothetical protein
MEPTSRSDEQTILLLEAQIRECFGRAVWSHKTQEKCVDIVLKLRNRIKAWLIALSALTTISLLFAIFWKNEIGTIVGVFLSIVLFGLTAYSKDFDLGEIAQKHLNAAHKLWNIKEMYLSLLIDIRIQKIKPDEIIAKRDFLQNELHNIYSGSPRTYSRAYAAARRSLRRYKDYMLSDEEIDTFLPTGLRMKVEENTKQVPAIVLSEA